jgi:hypothetical protein
MAPASTYTQETAVFGDPHVPDFDPEVHLAFRPPTQIHTFQELGLPQPQNAPNLCYTDPFPLFSEEGVRILRREMLSKPVLDKYLRSWDRAPAYIAGHEKVGSLLSLQQDF